MTEQNPSSYILWLPSWYPNKLEPLNGDFVQRHAEAVSLFHPLHVIFLVRDGEGTITKNIKIEESASGNVKQTVIYYYSFRFPLSSVNRFFSGLKYRRLYKQTINKHIRQYGKPKLVHAYVTMKTALIASWLKKKKNIPYVVSEQWTGYLPEAKEKFSDLPFYYQSLWKRAMKDAEAGSVVSDYLGSCLNKQLPQLNFTIIPNVVNTDIFKPAISNTSKITQFIHVSGLHYQKNPEDIIRSLAILRQSCSDFHLTIIGPHYESIHQLVKKLDLESFITFHLEMPQKELVKFVQKSHAFIFYSRYETFGCVIIEANACGVPVIASDIEVFHEIINEGENGIFVPGEDPAALAEKLFWFIQNKERFDSSAIATKAQSLYNYKTVGEQFSKWYDSVLKKM